MTAELTSGNERNVFVTGASNGLGRAVVRELRKYQHRVVGATDAGIEGAAKVRADGAIPTYPDLTRAGEIKSVLTMINADVVVHAAPASLNCVAPYSLADLADEDLLIHSTDALIQACTEANVKKLIYVSFAYLYDNHSDEDSLDESASLDRSDTLFRPGIEAEQRVLNSGLNAHIIRAGYIYGSGCSTMVELSQAFMTSKSVPEGAGIASWAHADDVASAIVLLVNRDEDDEPADTILNIADDTPVTSSVFATQLSESMGLGAPKLATPPPGWLTVIVGEDPRLTLLNKSVKISSEKAKSQLGWSPRYPSYVEGIEQSLMIWRAQEAVVAE